jgi:hypothetical protein
MSFCARGKFWGKESHTHSPPPSKCGRCVQQCDGFAHEMWKMMNFTLDMAYSMVSWTQFGCTIFFSRALDIFKQIWWHSTWWPYEHGYLIREETASAEDYFSSWRMVLGPRQHMVSWMFTWSLVVDLGTLGLWQCSYKVSGPSLIHCIRGLLKSLKDWKRRVGHNSWSSLSFLAFLMDEITLEIDIIVALHMCEPTCVIVSCW